MARYGKKKAAKRKRKYTGYGVYLGDVPYPTAEELSVGTIKVVPNDGNYIPMAERAVRAQIDRRLGRAAVVAGIEPHGNAVGKVRVVKTVEDRLANPAIEVRLKDTGANRGSIQKAMLATVLPPTKSVPFVVGSRGRGMPVFTPGIHRAAELYRGNPVFRAQIDSGRYVYVDGAFCLNRKDFVTVDTFGAAQLTAYAKDNAAECLMQFGTLSRPLGMPNIGRRGWGWPYRKPGMSGGKIRFPGRWIPFRRGGGYDGGFLPSCRIDLPTALLQGEPIAVAQIMEAGGAIRKAKSLSLPMLNELCRAISGKCFADAIGVIMDTFGFTIQDMEDATGIDGSKIKKFRKKDNKARIYQQDVLAIVIGLHLPPPIGGRLFESAKILLDSSDEDNFYGLIIGTMTDQDISEINKLLVQMGYSTIPRSVKPKKTKSN